MNALRVVRGVCRVPKSARLDRDRQWHLRRGLAGVSRASLLVALAVVVAGSVTSVRAQWLYTQRGVGYGVKDLGLVVRDHADSLVVLARARLLPNIGSDYERPDLAGFDPEDWVLAKFDSEKGLRWFHRMGGLDVPAFTRLAADRAGQILAAGFFEGTACLGTGPDARSLVSRGQRDICLAGFASDGSLISIRQWGSPDDELAESLTVADDGGVILAGSFKGTFTLSLPSGEISLRAPGPVRDGFVVSLDPSGVERWVLHAAVESPEDPGSSASLLPLSVGVDPVGNCYVTSGFEPWLHLRAGGCVSTIESRGTWDMFLAKLDMNGVLQWVRTAGGPGGDYGLRILLDEAGTSFVTGRFGHQAQFGDGIRAVQLQPTSFADIFMACYDSDGEFLGAARMGGIGHAVDRGAWTIVMDELGNHYLVGADDQPIQHFARPPRQHAADQDSRTPAAPNPPSRFLSIARLRDDGIRIILEGHPHGIYVIETSTDLREWAPVSTNRITAGLILIEDRIDPGNSLRFYRILQPATLAPTLR